MTLQYINSVASKANPWRAKSQDPVLTEEDEAFLQRVTSNPSVTEQASLLQEPSPTGKDAQAALMNGAEEIPLPASPTEGIEREPPAEAPGKIQDAKESQVQRSEPRDNKTPSSTGKRKKTFPWSWIRRSSMDTKKKVLQKQKVQDQEAMATSLAEIITKSKTSDGEPISDTEQQREQEDMSVILERLNLAAENNRVFSISDETQELLHKFKLIFRDLVTGVPTAYHDLESLLTNGDKQLRDAFGHLPSFLQKLVEQLPDKLTESIAPELLAAAGAKASQSGINMENAGKAAAATQKMGLKTPSLKELVGKPTALVGMLRSIVGFLRARFPAVMGMNVLWSLALFIILLVLWYCHKRGREVRLEKERLVTEAEVAQMNEEFEQHIRATETLSTTAPQGASIEEVNEGIQEVQKTREQALKADDDAYNDKTESDHPASTTIAPATRSITTTTTTNGNGNGNDNSKPSISRRFSLFKSASKRTNSNSDVQPYPGT